MASMQFGLRSLGPALSAQWTHWLFPATGEVSCSGNFLAPFRAGALLVVLASLLFLTQLRSPLQEPQEPRYAEVARQMLAEGSWVVPVLHGEPYLDKPPLFYWLIMASYQIFGVHDWAARLVPGLAGVLTVLTTWLWGRAVVGDRAAFWAGLILCLSARFVYLERLLTFDCLLCLTVTTGLAAAHVALSRSQIQWRWWLISAALCGLGVLTKGPVALVLIAVPVVMFGSLDTRSPRPTPALVAAYLGVAGLVAAPWFIALMIRQPSFASYFFWTHNVVRFIAPFDHEQPFWYHLPGLLLGMLPWSLLLPGLFLGLGRRCLQPAVGFFMLASIWGLLFYSLAGCKRAVYILPAIPPLALALGTHLARWHDDPSFRLQASRLAGLASVVLVLIALATTAAAVSNLLLAPECGILPCCVLLLVLPLLMFARLRSWPACAGLTFVLLFGAIELILPGYSRQFALRDQLVAHGQAGSDALNVICYPQWWDSVGFYLPAAKIQVFSAGEEQLLVAALQARPGTLLAVRSGRWQRDLMRKLPRSLQFVAAEGQGSVTAGWVRLRQERPSRAP